MSTEPPDTWTLPERAVTINGKAVVVRRMNVRQHLHLAPHLRGRSLAPLMDLFAPAAKAESDPAASTDWLPKLLGLLSSDGEWLLTLIAIASHQDEQDLGLSGPDELLLLGAAVVELNLDFFTQRLAPVMAQAAEGLMQRLTIGVGSTPSKP